MDYAVVLSYVAIAAVILAIVFRKRLLAWRIHLKVKFAKAPAGAEEPALLASRLYELNKVIDPFGTNAAHPSALFAQPQFVEATRLLALPSVSLAVVLQYVEGNSWSLASAALAALKRRPNTGDAVERVLSQCAHYSPWAMYFALEFLAESEPRPAVGAPAARAKDWWIDNRWMPNIFRDYFARCAARGDAVTFGTALREPGSSPNQIIRRFLQKVAHPSATTLIAEIDAATPPEQIPAADTEKLKAVGRFWNDTRADILVEPDAWKEAFALAEAALEHHPPRSLLVSGEALVGKTSFLRLLGERVAAQGWSVFEASGADLQADQIYIGQLEGRLRQVVDELGKNARMIWYIPDIVQLATSGRHQGQSATMLDQIIPAISAGRLQVWCEATPKGATRLFQLKPSLRGLFETVTLEPMPHADALLLARHVTEAIDKRAGIRFHPDCAEVALDTACQYLGSSGLPGSALLMLKLSAARAERTQEAIAPRQVLEALSQFSGLPVSMLDTKEQLDLDVVRAFFTARVMGQDEAVGAMVDRIAMLKAGLNDPDRPIGVFLFAGPTGTGKTELAKAVSEFLFGSIERMIRLDMSEFQALDSISKILGQSTPTPGVETDSLISRVRKQPFSVILLDEFEKSHPNIWDLFLQAFDEGRLTDATGQIADLRHCLIVMTSNLGASAHRSAGLGFAPPADVFSKEQVLRAISQTYRPEFQNRLDKVIVFQPLTRELMRGILKKQLAELLERRGLKDRAWAIEWESSALEFLLARGFSPEMGARPLKRAIDQYVVAPLASIIVERRFPEGEQFLFVRSDGNGIQVEFVDPDADAKAVETALPLAPTEAAPASTLASIILAPQGKPAEFHLLQSEYKDTMRTVDSAEWQELKDKLAAEMASPEFWHGPDRFHTLARFALIDRVKAATETAKSLDRRLARYSQSSERHSAELTRRMALQLHLIREGVKDVMENAPVELALVVEPVFGDADDRQSTLAWCGKLRSMYRSWAGQRHMHISELGGPNLGGSKLVVPSKDHATPALVVSGFGAYRTLAAEAGLHIFDPSEGSDKRVTARVRLAAVPLGDLPAAKERAAILKVLDDAPRPNTVVRRYREEPPLVRDAGGKWRTGRLDLVLGGEFDLLQAGHGGP